MLSIMGQLLLALCTVCALLSAGSALRCNSCASLDISGTCRDMAMTCPASQTSCAVMAVTGTSTTTVYMKFCTQPEACTGPISVNFGIIRTNINTKCCSTDLCNTGTNSAYTNTTPSGLECYSCMGDVCKETVMKCLGVEDRCSKFVVEAEGKKFMTKGCVSKNTCSSKSIPGVSIPDVSIPGVSAVIYCCEGKLCNGALQVGQNILLLLFPLLIVKLLF